MTIIFFTRRFYPDVGGVEKHVFEISKRLKNKGYKVIIITESKSNSENVHNYQYVSESAKLMGKSDQIQVHTLKVTSNMRFKKYQIWLELWKMRNVIKSADIVHCHDVFFWYLPFRILYPRKKVFTTFHGYESYPISKKAILIRKLSAVLSFGNICIGDYIQKWYKTNPTYVSYGAVSRTNHQEESGKASALFFGRLDDQTGIMTYLKAYKKIKKIIPSFSLKVVGDGTLKYKLPIGVKHIGFDPEISKYIQKYKIIFVSRYLSILEGLEAKRMVFAVYDNPIKKDYLEMAPFKDFIHISGSSDDLSTKVVQYLSRPNSMSNKITQGYKWAIKQTWENLVDTYLALWNYK